MDMGPRRSTRPRTTLGPLKDFDCNTLWICKTHSSSAPTTHSASSGKSLYPLNHYVSCDKFSVAHKNFVASISTISEPTWFADAISDPKQRDAMEHEIEALE